MHFNSRVATARRPGGKTRSAGILSGSNTFDRLDEHEDAYQNALDYMVECLEEIEPSVSAVQAANRGSTQVDSVSSFSLSHLPPHCRHI